MICATDSESSYIRSKLFFLSLFPFRGFGYSNQTFFDTNAVIKELITRSLRTCLEDIPKPEFNWIHLQLFGDLIHLRFCGEVYRNVSKTSEASTKHFVCIDSTTVDRSVGNLIGSSGMSSLPP